MEKAMEFLEQLAKELGVAVEYLWSILVKQQYVEGVTNIVMASIGFITIIILACCLPKVTKFFINKKKEMAEDRKKNGTGYCGSHTTSSESEDFISFLRFATPTAFCVAILLIFIFSLSDIEFGIKQLLNPDYFALKEILNAISGS